MALRRIFVDQIQGRVAEIRGQRAHHFSRVARLAAGEQVEISDRQRLYLATVKTSRGTLVEFDIEQELETPPPGPKIVLMLSIIKLARFEWAVEKAAELGAASIVPVAADRSEPRLIDAAAKRRERWERIADEAAQQCRRMAPPVIERSLPFSDAVENCRAVLRLMPDIDGGSVEKAVAELTLNEACAPACALLIGPEGGWTGDEREAARRSGFSPVDLGPLVLRSETAAIAALAVVSQLLRQER